MSGERDPVTALERGAAFVDLSSWWKITVRGADAPGWLNDLLSAELSGLEPGEARRSLLLTPTGRIRAAINVTPFEDGYLLLQDPVQPARIETVLDPFVLSSAVRLADRSEDLGLFAFPGAEPPAAEGAAVASPSVLGPGVDVVTLGAGSPPPAVRGLVEADPQDVEAWRVRKGTARFGVDLSTDSLPQEVELGEIIAYGKGCFLGQEAVARIRNLGHPPFVLLAVEAGETVQAGEPVLGDEREAGTVTSATSVASGGTAAIARVRWALRDTALRTGSGVELRPRGLASAA